MLVTKYRILKARDLIAGAPIRFDKAEQLLAVVFPGEHDLAFDRTTQHNDPS
ncbi:MAG: hypothetical protein AWT59_3088 [Candidatus Gallionella acididurans]|uniref:Uncharacterized protein n=1 Tax=Candidatus Gallionella acididurans TaxID=1796491 RepID=A0A139BQ07_9PROT|nr:MAG: hypothetical protein AWT59_3088 [Candidatus Gallionella acididurans]